MRARRQDANRVAIAIGSKTRRTIETRQTPVQLELDGWNRSVARSPLAGGMPVIFSVDCSFAPTRVDVFASLWHPPRPRSSVVLLLLVPSRASVLRPSSVRSPTTHSHGNIFPTFHRQSCFHWDCSMPRCGLLFAAFFTFLFLFAHQIRSEQQLFTMRCALGVSRLFPNASQCCFASKVGLLFSQRKGVKMW